jgi:hypothetical protein
MFELGSKTSNRLASEDRYASLGVLGNNEIVIEGFLFQSFETYDELLDSVHKSEKDHRNRNRVRPFFIFIFYLILCHTYTLSYLLGSRILDTLEQSCHLDEGAQPTEEKLDAIR